MIVQDVREFSSRYRNGELMYPGKWLLTWASAPWGWILISMQGCDQ